jgi:hypothetical protein
LFVYKLTVLANNGVHELRSEPGREEMTAPAITRFRKRWFPEWSHMREWASSAICELARQHRTRSGWKGNTQVKLTEAFIGTHIAGAKRDSNEVWVIIHRTRGGFHLSRYLITHGQRTSQLWTFPNLYELLLFAQDHGFTEVDAEAKDWQPVFSAS